REAGSSAQGSPSPRWRLDGPARTQEQLITASNETFTAAGGTKLSAGHDLCGSLFIGPNQYRVRSPAYTLDIPNCIPARLCRAFVKGPRYFLAALPAQIEPRMEHPPSVFFAERKETPIVFVVVTGLGGIVAIIFLGVAPQACIFLLCGTSRRS